MNSVTISTHDTTITAKGSVEGLLEGDEEVRVELSATVECVTPGGRVSQTADVKAHGRFPIVEGHATFSVSGGAMFDRPCKHEIRFSEPHVTVLVPYDDPIVLL